MVHQHLTVARQFAPSNMTAGVPKACPVHSFGAVQVSLTNLDENTDLGGAPLDGQTSKQVHVVGNPTDAVNSKSFGHAWHEKKQCDLWIIKQVSHRIEPIIADAIRKQDVTIIENVNEAGGITSRRDIAASGPLRTDDAECGASEDRPAVFVQCG